MNYIETAVARIREFCPPEGYWLAFSGGKDSQCIYHLAEMAGVEFDAHYSVTTIDPPELVRFIKRQYPGVAFEHPAVPMLKRMETRGFPNRKVRWCCEEYKENGGDNRTVLLGLRWEESVARSKRRMIHHCTMGGRGSKVYVSPIIDWSVGQVWEFLGERPHCSLYDEGWSRIGCLLCPCAGPKKRLQESRRYPRLTARYIKAFEAFHATGRESTKRWKDGREMFWWWMESPDEEKQQELFV